MKSIPNEIIFIFFISLGVFALYLLAPILTPFLFGALLAYLTDPLVKKFQQYHLSHLLSVIVAFLIVFSIFLLLVLMLIPLIQNQTTVFIDSLPGVVSWLQKTVIPQLNEYINTNSMKEALSQKSALLFGTALRSGQAILQWIVDLVLIPVVMFYMLEDWDSILQSIKDILPASIKPTVLKLAKECDEVLSAFFRGQLLIMISLALIYGTGLTLIGLRGGFIIGLLGGIFSIVPYVGSLFVVVMSSITALIQFNEWQSLFWVFLVFAIGQAIEGFVLTPYLVGNRIGLHPVAVIFAILAGGTLFGFFGVLLALPVTALMVVILRFIRREYALD